MTDRPSATVRTRISVLAGSEIRERNDLLVSEEPLEIRVSGAAGHSGEPQSLAVTMRTPGADFLLAAGFLHAEGIVRRAADIVRLSYCTDTNEPQRHNIVQVDLDPKIALDLSRYSRHVFTAAGCGICGKTVIDAVMSACRPLTAGSLQVNFPKLCAMAETFRKSQPLFSGTGGLHGAALFDGAGKLHSLQEDIGRHNAVDKLIGEFLLAERLPAGDGILFLSGRAGFELVQKAALAGIPFVAAVGAPSSLAVSLARSCNMTLVGFLREDRCNVYAGGERLNPGK